MNPTLQEAKRQATFHLLLRAARLVDEAAIARVNAEAGRPVARRALLALFPHVDLEGTRLGDLAERLGVTKQAVSKSVGELAEQGVLEVVPDPTDGRARLVRFTPRGLEAIHHGLGVLAALEAEASARIGPDRMAALHDALTALLAALDASRG